MVKTKELIPKRRKHGCDVCYKDIPTQLFLGYRLGVLWICSECYNKITKGIKRQHNQDIFTEKKWR